MAAPHPTRTQPVSDPMRSIAEVERETGIARTTLRIWERRYGFPQPGRDARGERAYPADQVEQLRQMRRLTEQGWRPAELLARGADAIRLLAAPAAAAPRRSRSASRLIELLRSHDAAAVRRELADRLARAGLARFAAAELSECNLAIGEAWSSGELQIHEEHLYTDCADTLLREAIESLQGGLRPEAPRVLLTTFPQEAHGLGLRMAQAQFALQGCPTVSLGVGTPVAQIAAAADSHRAELVGLSFSGAHNPAHLLRGLEELRGLLPPAIRIWAGGHAPVLRRRQVAGVRVVEDAAHIPALLAEDFALAPR
jgi:DNA-binding transcriptional MerR regulator/methylmalonyl-CoA mutase cobalamin-binding subunit